jgi:hypothetical protein
MTKQDELNLPTPTAWITEVETRQGPSAQVNWTRMRGSHHRPLFTAEQVRECVRVALAGRTLDPHKVQICRVAPIDYDNGQPCACPEGACGLWKGGMKPHGAKP